MSNFRNTVEAAARGTDLADLLNHIAWTDIIVPELTKAKDRYSTTLVQKVLGNSNSSTLTIEQLAGRIAGIEFVYDLLTRIVERGEKASTILQEQQYTLDNPYNSKPSTN
jgi:hypothetical protein